jgi:Protein of unknown function (DUF3102)
MAHPLRIPVRDLASSVASEINAVHREVVRSIADGVMHAIRAGELLSRAKANVGHGGWRRWQEKNLAFSVRTAQLYMQLARLDPNAQRVADLPLRQAVLKLQRLDREEKQQAERRRREEQGRQATEERRERYVDGLRDPKETENVVLGIVNRQLDALQVQYAEPQAPLDLADDLIDRLLEAAVEDGITKDCLVAALCRRFGLRPG